MTTTGSTLEALAHLKSLKPLDGWSVQHKPNTPKDVSLVRLLRRNVPVTDNYFLDLHLDPKSNTVVGILTPLNNNNNSAQAQILVDASGKPVDKKVTLITVSTWRPNTTSAAPSSTSRSSSSSTGTLSHEENKQLMMYFGYAVGGAILFRFVLSAFVGLYLLALPILYVYAVFHCPSEASFDAKKELKRVLRGHHLPDDHPDKPKGFFHETIARVSASVAAELATLPGYEVRLIPLAGAAIVASTKVPSANNMEFYWIGAFDKWWYVYCKQPDNNQNQNQNQSGGRR